ncbi:ribonuclease HII, partial [Candidatus Uhrbacteria bacterium]|nr:ribonuclease HII [Candidatus Uhrbacteria bacterium]
MDGGFRAIVGVDEVGVGPLAGPVVAGAVHLPLEFYLPNLRDSKQLNVHQREVLAEEIREAASCFAVGEASVEEINTMGIRQATYLAMRRALAGIVVVDFVLVDALTIPDLPYPQQGIIRGDATIASIAAASILAKVTRDARMKEFAAHFPEYGFAEHKGYGTPQHVEAIVRYGPCALHRTSWGVFAS